MLKTLLILILLSLQLPGRSEGKKRDQKGQWIRVAPCLCRYRSSGIYYAAVRRSGKLIRRSLETDTIEVAKRKLRDFQGEQENAASDAHKTYLDVHMKEFLAGRTGAPKTLKRYRQTETENLWRHRFPHDHHVETQRASPVGPKSNSHHRLES